MIPTSMKVLFVSSGNSKNFEIVPFIKEQGESLKRIGIHIDYFPVQGKGVIGYLTAGIKLRKYLKDKDYDLIHAHFTLSGYTAIIGARQTPVVLSLMGSDAYGEYIGENKVQFLSRYLTVLTYLIQPFVSAIISKSPNIEKYVYQKQKSSLIPNGIDISKFKPVINGFREELGLNPNLKYVLFLGSKDSVRKNIKLVQKAINQLNSNDIELVNPYPISHEDIPKYLNSVNALAVSSYMEGSPNVIKEAMACNCPIVSTDIGDVSWVLGNTPGCYIASFHPGDYSNKLQEALDFSIQVGRTKGDERIFKLGLDSESIAKQIFNIYKKIVK